MCRTELLIENRMPHKESHHSQIVSNLSNRGKNQNSIFYKQDLNVSVTKCNKGKYLCALCSNEYQPKPRDDKNDVSTDIKRWNLLQIQRTFFKCATKKVLMANAFLETTPFKRIVSGKKSSMDAAECWASNISLSANIQWWNTSTHNGKFTILISIFA